MLMSTDIYSLYSLNVFAADGGDASCKADDMIDLQGSNIVFMGDLNVIARINL